MIKQPFDMEALTKFSSDTGVLVKIECISKPSDEVILHFGVELDETGPDALIEAAEKAVQELKKMIDEEIAKKKRSAS